MSDNPPERKVRVIDRRSFTAEGELKPETELPPPERPAAPPTTATPPAEEARSTPPQGRGPGFFELVDFFAQQVVLLLSEQAQSRGADRDAARYLIDLLAVVEEKARGQLSAEEKRYIDDALYQLRTLFVAAIR